MMRVWPALLVAAIVCGCNKSKPASGTELVRWEKAMESEAAVVAATEIGPRKINDVTIEAQTNLKGPVTIRLHLETAPIQIAWNADAPEHLSSPVAARIVADGNDDWSLSSNCDEGLHRKLGQEDRMLKTCRISMKHVDTRVDVKTSFSVEMSGDGTVKADGPSELGFKFTIK